MSLQGYKIYWGYSADSLDAVHPTNAIYNSPITVAGGATTNYTFPSGFWDSATFDSTSIFFSIVAYGDDGEGTPSKPIQLAVCRRQLDNSEYSFCIPLDDGNVYTPKQLMSILGASRISVRSYGSTNFKQYLVFSADGPALTPNDEILVLFTDPDKVLVWRGTGWQIVD